MTTKQTKSDKPKKSIIVKCKRLFKAKIADVRSHVVEKAKIQNKDLQIVIPNIGTQIFSPSDGVVLIEKQFVSKKGTKPYRLVSFFWQKEEDYPVAQPRKVEAPQAEFSFN